MANYTLTAGTDSLVGGADVADSFFIGAAGRLAGSDTVLGGGGNVIDQLVLQAGMALAAGAFANARGVERILITAAAGGSVVLDDAMAAASDLASFSVVGGGGGDTVSGAGVVSKALTLLGGGGNDSLVGGGGNDLLNGGAGLDTIDAGAGADLITAAIAYLGAGDVIDGGAGIADTLRLTTAGGTLSPGVVLRGIERIEALASLTTALVFRLPTDLAPSEGATVTVAGAGGNDVIAAGPHLAAVVLLGGAGDDRLTGSTAGDLLVGATGADTLTGYFGNDTLSGEAGDDRLIGGIGNDLLDGGADNDRLSGGTGNDTLDAGAGNDFADGGAGNDWHRFLGADFTTADLVADEDGSLDTLEFTGAGPVAILPALAARIGGIERFFLTPGDDTIVIGNDIADTAASAVVTVDGGAGADLLDAAAVTSLGTPKRFWLLGGDGADRLVGSRGNDTLDGGSGPSSIHGGLGDDLLIAATEDLGTSTIDGGAGFADVLRLTGGGTLDQAAFAGVTGIEILELGPEGTEATIRPSMVAGSSSPAIDVTVRGGSGEDRIDTTLLAAGTDIRIEVGAGDDTVVGGAGDDTVAAGGGIDQIFLGTGTDRAIFGAGELTLLDQVVADQGVAGDVLEVTLAANRTLPGNAFAGVQGIDTFLFDAAGAGAAVRLPANLVGPSGLTTVLVDVIADDGVFVDGRALTGRVTMSGGNGDDTLLGGSAADTVSGSAGEDTVVGGDGGDQISLGLGGTDRDVAVITASTDGTVDINGTLSAGSLAGADRVTGLGSEGNFIAVDWEALGLAGGSTLFNNAGGNIDLGWGSIVLPTSEAIAGNAFGSLTAVRNVVGSRITGGVAGVDERMILVIGGADNTEFGVYFFEDRDDNATVDVADVLMLLAIGDTDVPVFGGGRGFTLTTLDLV